MYKLFISYFLMLLSIVCVAQPKIIGCNNSFIVSKETQFFGQKEVCTDKNNNVYYLGAFKGTIYIDTFTLVSSISGSSTYSKSIFLVKCSPDNKVIWAKKIIEGDTIVLFTMNVDYKNNIYFAGYFSGNTKLYQDSLVSNGEFDIALMKIDSNGNLIYKKSVGGSANEVILNKGLTIDDSNNLYLFGDINATYYSTNPNYTMMFDTISITCHSRQNFIAKYNENGDALWVKHFGSIIEDYASDIVFADNYLYICGTTEGNKDTICGLPISFTAPYTSFNYIAKIDTNGIGIWAKKFGSNTIKSSTLVSSLAAKNNRVYFGCTSIAQSGGLSSFIMEGGPSLSGLTTTDYFLGCYNASGNFIFNKASASFYPNFITDMIVDSNSGLVSSGIFSGNLLVGTDTLTSRGSQNGFVLSYDSNGVYQYALCIGGTSSEQATAIDVAPNGTIHVVGGMTSFACLLGNDTLLNPTSETYFWATTIDSISAPQLPNAIATTAQRNTFLLYPNPASNVVHLQFGTPQYNATITISNTMGQKLYSNTFNTTNNQYKLLLPKLPSGVYVVNVGGRNLQLAVIDLQ